MEKKKEGVSIPWTQFWDMHSGGGTKEAPYEKIYIQAPEDQAEIIFYRRFGHSPNRVSCTCCGEDYSISESETIEEATAFQRGCRYGYTKDGVEVPRNEAWVSGKGIQEGYKGGYIESPDGSKDYESVEDYTKRHDVLVIRDSDITDEERVGDVPAEGYVWI